LAIKAPLILSLNVGLPRTMGTEGAADPMDRPWTSAILKEHVEGPVWLSSAGLKGDAQSDTKDHGGSDMAVLAYAADHYPVWRVELNQPFLKYGAFGENLTVSRMDESSVCIGDTYAIGDARVQVSHPRLPCWKLARRLRVEDMIQRVHAKGWGGWYLRVLAEGFVERSSFVVLEDRPYAQWDVARVYSVYRGRRERPEAAAELARCHLLSESWRQSLAGKD